MENEKASTPEKIMPIDVSGLNVLLDENDMEVKLVVWNYLSQKYVEETMRRDKITPKALKKVIQKNAGVCRDEKALFSYIDSKINAMLESKAAIKAGMIGFVHHKLGWTTYDGDLVFDSNKIYLEDRVIPSRYSGSFAIQPAGSIDAIRQLFDSTLCTNIPLQAVMAMAAAATVLPYANQVWKTSLYNVVNHLTGDSTTGKTTGAYLFGAFGGNPEDKDGFFLSFLGTDNAIVKQIGSNSGYPVVIDEFSTSISRQSCSSFVYVLANGRGKAKCYAGGMKVQEINEFSTIFLTTGEMSILEKCSENTGIRARLFEYYVDEGWTRSADESDKIKAVCKKNFGFLTPMIAQRLMIEDTRWHACFNKWRNAVRGRIHEAKLLLSIGDRIADFVALYVTSCELLSDVLGVTMSINDVYDFFFTHIIFKNAEDANLGIRAYEYVVSYYSKNQNRFPRLFPLDVEKNDGFTLEDDQIGFVMSAGRKKSIDGIVYADYLAIYPDDLAVVLRNNGVTDKKVALKAIQKEGRLRSKDKNRLYIEKTINGVKTKVHMFWVDAKW